MAAGSINTWTGRRRCRTAPRSALPTPTATQHPWCARASLCSALSAPLRATERLFCAADILPDAREIPVRAQTSWYCGGGECLQRSRAPRAPSCPQSCQCRQHSLTYTELCFLCLVPSARARADVPERGRQALRGASARGLLHGRARAAHVHGARRCASESRQLLLRPSIPRRPHHPRLVRPRARALARRSRRS